ncbi:hypothetical protein ACLB2K_012306 [Fragaria x ananassa]
MELYKMSFALISLTAAISLALLHSIHAQDSPQDYLDAHNAARAAVGVAPLTWDDQVARFAQDYANTHVDDCQAVHSNGQYGENLAMGFGDLSGTDAVNLWIGEQADYDYNFNTCAAGCEFIHHKAFSTLPILLRRSLLRQVPEMEGKMGCGRGGFVFEADLQMLHDSSVARRFWRLRLGCRWENVWDGREGDLVRLGDEWDRRL